jgi:hypothetical protein
MRKELNALARRRRWFFCVSSFSSAADSARGSCASSRSACSSGARAWAKSSTCSTRGPMPPPCPLTPAITSPFDNDLDFVQSCLASSSEPKINMFWDCFGKLVSFRPFQIASLTLFDATHPCLDYLYRGVLWLSFWC